MSNSGCGIRNVEDALETFYLSRCPISMTRNYYMIQYDSKNAVRKYYGHDQKTELTQNRLLLTKDGKIEH